MTSAQFASDHAEVDRQESIGRDYCLRHKLSVVDVMCEALRGHAPKRRPILVKALERCANGDADVLVALDVASLARTVADFADVLEEAERAGYGIVVTSVGLDTTTLAGKRVLEVVRNAAESERLAKSSRFTGALATRKAKVERMDRTSTFEAIAAKLIQHYRAQGLSFAAIANVLNERGIVTNQGSFKWYSASVRRVLLRNGEDVQKVTKDGTQAA